MTALHWAVEKRHDKIVERLLQHGADPNAVSKFGKSPISIATEAGQVDLVRILLLANQMRAASQEQVGRMDRVLAKRADLDRDLSL